MYRRAALLGVGGFDARFTSYEGCDLHTRLMREVGGRFEFVPTAVVSHRHRPTWRAYWRQQVGYGRGYAQFFRKYADELDWDANDEARAWIRLATTGLACATAWRGDDALVRRGTFVKALAQRIGFARTYWNRGESARWRHRPELGGQTTT
jgi:GT2 family glycosyltransferase